MRESRNKAASHQFGLWTLIALVVGNAVGAGIYTTSGFSLADLGSREWVMLAWFVAGVIAIMGALSYGMLANGITESGGEYLYLARSIHPLAGFIAGWISLLAGFPGAIAFAATAFETYLRSAVDLNALAGDSLAVGIILFAGSVHIIKVKAGAKTHEWIVGLMLLILVLIVVWGIARFSSDPELPIVSGSLSEFSWLAFANSLVWISLSYSGFNAAAYVAGEVKNPKRTVTRGMVIGTFITMILCLLVNGIVLYGTPVASIAGQADIAAIAAQSLGGETGRRIVEGVIAISLLTSITAMVLAGPRVYAKMAEDGALPRFFRARTGEPPRASIALQVGTAIALVLIADLQDLLSYLGLTLSLCLALAVSSLFVRHWRLSEIPDSKWYPIAPILFVSATVLFAVLSAISQPAKLFAVIPTIALGAFAYFISTYRKAANA